MPNTKEKRPDIKTVPDIKLLKKGSAHTSFYINNKLPKKIEEILVSSLALKGIVCRIPPTKKD